MRHVHVAIENAKSLFQNELNQGVASFIPFSHAARTNEFHMVKLFSLANASIEITANQRNLSISNSIAQNKTQIPLLRGWFPLKSRLIGATWPTNL